MSKRLDISIHALREEGDRDRGVEPSLPTVISIHALREEGDRCVQLLNQRIEVISIHALREEGDDILKSPLNLL